MKKYKTYLWVRVPLGLCLTKQTAESGALLFLRNVYHKHSMISEDFFFLLLLVGKIPLSNAINFDLATTFLFPLSSELSNIEASKAVDLGQITRTGKWNCIFIYFMQN